ncbi:hypothetical protein Tco_1057159 [Tanacetum coccineum]|uniref:Retroviral polymerase SH3-like domain-containing protein n=1 Tax=Tanacetum coccineum TaxID=301880 RepID=A0ABQ5H4K1_9ASTR
MRVRSLFGLLLLKPSLVTKGALDPHKLITRRSRWQDVILAIHSLQSKGEVALRIDKMVVWSRLRKNLSDEECSTFRSEDEEYARVAVREFKKFFKRRGYSQNSKAYIILNKHTRKVKESLNVTFDETPPPSKTSPLVDDDLDEEEAIKVTEKKNLENNIMDETLEVDEIVNIKKSRNHPLENVIGNLNQRTLSNITALAISTTEAEYVSAGKACQQALWIENKLSSTTYVDPSTTTKTTTAADWDGPDPVGSTGGDKFGGGGRDEGLIVVVAEEVMKMDIKMMR